jgi:hypothetical protein
LHNRYLFPAKGIALEIALPAQVSRQYTHLTRDDKRRRAAVAGCDERLIIPEMNAIYTHHELEPLHAAVAVIPSLGRF